MSGLSLSRLAAALIVATLMAGALAAPAAAANPTRWVDDDAGGSGGPSQCATAAFTSIQDAIDASGSWDRVRVCPGTYAEQLVLDVKGILVEAAPHLGAKIAAPVVLTPTGGVVAVVRMTAWAARLVGFEIEVMSGPPILLPVTAGGVANGPGICTHADVAVLVLGHRSKVRGNSIGDQGLYTQSGICGYDYGIVFGQHLLSPSLRPAPFRKAKTGRAAYNVVQEFKRGGILIEGSDYITRVDHNTVTYDHSADPGCGTTIGPCLPIARPSVVNEAFADTFGIGAEDGAAALITNNTVTSAFTASPTAVSSDNLANGIALNGASDASKVLSNQVSGAQYGIWTTGNTDVPATFGLGGAEIRSNTVTSGYQGFKIDDNGHDIFANVAHDNAYGLVVAGSWNLLHGRNNFAVNSSIDCVDLSPAGSGSDGTSNEWVPTENIGASSMSNVSAPAGLCHAP